MCRPAACLIQGLVIDYDEKPATPLRAAKTQKTLLSAPEVCAEMKYSKFAVTVLSVVTCTLTAGRAENLSGIVTGSDGRRISSAIVTAIGTSKVPWTASNSTSGSDGAFAFSNLPAGAYHLCVQVPAGGYLNPCAWSNTPPALTIAAGQSVTGFQVKIAAGSVLKLRLNDPNSVLKSAGAAPPPVMMSVHAPGALFVPFAMSAKDQNGSDHVVTIPFDVPVRVSVQSNQLSLANSDGPPVAAGSAVSVTHSSSSVSAAPVLTFQITGAKP